MMRFVRYALAAALLALPLAGEDVEFLRAWEAHQKERPRSVSSVGYLAPRGEPGTLLRVEGRLLTGDGRAIVRDAIVFAWQTDASGVYDRPGTPPHSWRLHGWSKTDRDGRFRFKTIRPGAYPNGSIPAHIHFSVQRSNGMRYFTRDLIFDDDPLLTPALRQTNRDVIGRVRTLEGAQFVEIDLRLEESRRF